MLIKAHKNYGILDKEFIPQYSEQPLIEAKYSEECLLSLPDNIVEICNQQGRKMILVKDCNELFFIHEIVKSRIHSGSAYPVLSYFDDYYYHHEIPIEEEAIK